MNFFTLFLSHSLCINSLVEKYRLRIDIYSQTLRELLHDGEVPMQRSPVNLIHEFVPTPPTFKSYVFFDKI